MRLISPKGVLWILNDSNASYFEAGENMNKVRLCPNLNCGFAYNCSVQAEKNKEFVPPCMKDKQICPNFSKKVSVDEEQGR